MGPNIRFLEFTIGVKKNMSCFNMIWHNGAYKITIGGVHIGDALSPRALVKDFKLEIIDKFYIEKNYFFKFQSVECINPNTKKIL